MTYHTDTYRLSDAGRFGRTALMVGIVGLVIGAIGAVVDINRFFHGWLVAFSFWTTLALGGLFFTMLHHLTGSRWSVVVRRLAETLAQALPLMGILFIPILLGLHSLYHWSHAEAVAEDALLQHKSGYLNLTFFTIRAVIYFTVWTLLARRLRNLSVQQDNNGSPELSAQMRKTSAYGMILFAVTVTFAGFDWLMSLDPHWYSTIFGVYFFAGGLLSVVCLLVVILNLLRRAGVLDRVVTIEHYHDLGKLMFGFVIFWTYIAFSQYFLIWYANIPEETVWFLERWEGSWKQVSLLILFGHFALPFLVMTFRAVKRNTDLLMGVAIWILIMHWVDMYWLVLPNLLHHGFDFPWIDLALTAGMGGVAAWWVWSRLVAEPLIPVKDPLLPKSLSHVNPF